MSHDKQQLLSASEQVTALPSHSPTSVIVPRLINEPSELFLVETPTLGHSTQRLMLCSLSS